MVRIQCKIKWINHCVLYVCRVWQLWSRRGRQGSGVFLLQRFVKFSHLSKLFLVWIIFFRFSICFICSTVLYRQALRLWSCSGCGTKGKLTWTCWEENFSQLSSSPCGTSTQSTECFCRRPRAMTTAASWSPRRLPSPRLLWNVSYQVHNFKRSTFIM